MLFLCQQDFRASASMSFVPTRSGPIASNAPSVMLSGESLTGRRGAAALSRTPATVSEPAEPAPSRAMNPPPVPGGEIEEAPDGIGDVESGDAPSRAPHRAPPPAQAWTMIVGACVVLVLMFGMFGTTAVMRQRVRDSTLEQIPNADGSAEKVPVFGPEIPRIRSKGTLCIKHPHHLPIASDVPPPEPEPQEVNAVAWRKFADALADEARIDGSKLVLLGDSITEAWRGTQMDVRQKQYDRAGDLVRKELGELDPRVLAIAGDQTKHLMWRLEHGGFPPENNSPEYVALMIGTNDVGAAVRTKNGGWQNGMCVSDDNIGDSLDAVDPTVAGVKAIIGKVRKLAPKARVVVLGLTPRGEKHGKGWSLRRSYLQPSMFTPALDEINRRVEEYVESVEEVNRRRPTKGLFGKRRGVTVFQPCAEGFLKNDGGEIRKDLMRDALHPSGRGLDVLMRCITDGIGKADTEHDRLVDAGDDTGGEEEEETP